MFCPERPRSIARRPHRQRGVTLLEVLVGLVIGMIAVASAVQALTALQLAQSATSQSLQLQTDVQQAMQNLTQEIRLAGSATVSASSGGAVRVTDSPTPFVNASLNNGQVTLELRYATPTGAANAGCLWRSTSGLGATVSSSYSVTAGTLRCNNNGSTQPLINQVAEFTALFATHSPLGLQWQTADQTNFNRVVGVVVCLHVTSATPSNSPPVTPAGCDGSIIAADGHIHIVEKGVAFIRSAPPL